MRDRMGQAARGASWVVDGNYSSVRNLIWPQAEAVVWLDYPLALILWWLWERTWKRVLTRENFWQTNREMRPSIFDELGDPFAKVDF
jgi:hypothetical protein